MIHPFAAALAQAELTGTPLHAGPTPTRGREVPPDRIAEPEFRPLYPRQVKFIARTASRSEGARLRVLSTPALRAEAARHRVAVALEACERREAMLADRHISALIGGAA